MKKFKFTDGLKTIALLVIGFIIITYFDPSVKSIPDQIGKIIEVTYFWLLGWAAIYWLTGEKIKETE